MVLILEISTGLQSVPKTLIPENVTLDKSVMTCRFFFQALEKINILQKQADKNQIKSKPNQNKIKQNKHKNKEDEHKI